MLLQRNWVFDASNSGVAIFEMGGGHIHMNSSMGGGSMKQEVYFLVELEKRDCQEYGNCGI